MPVRRLNSSSASISARRRRPAGRVGRGRQEDRAGARIAGRRTAGRGRASSRRRNRARRVAARRRSGGWRCGCWAIAARHRRRWCRHRRAAPAPCRAPACRSASTVVREMGMGWPCMRRLVVGQRLVERAIAAHVGDVEGEPLVEGRLRRVADEGRRHHVAFAVPERDDVAEFLGAQRRGLAMFSVCRSRICARMPSNA